MDRGELHRDLADRVLVHRRRFLGLMAAGAGALALGACSDGESETSTSTTSVPGTGPTTAPLSVPPGTGIDSDPFLLGVASGDPLPDSVVLWTRLATDLEDRTGFGGLGETDHAVLWEMGTDEELSEIVASGVEPAPAELGHSVHAEPTDLAPDTTYWFRFRIGEHTSEVARTRTAPIEDATVDELRIAFASCQLRSAGHWTAYTQMVADEPDLILFLGDYVYEYPSDAGPFPIPLDAEPETVADHRLLYAAYQRDPQIRAAHAIAPWVVTWDDHEVQNNYAADASESIDDAAAFSARRRAAYQVFWESMPLRIAPPAEDGSLALHRSLRWGELAEIFVLDGRQHRSDQPCGGGVAVSRSDCADLDDPDATMLGAEQEAWLTDGLSASPATWKVLAQQTVMKALVIGDIVLNVDQWDGYPAARQRLLQGIADGEVDNVIVLTGDIHAAGAADLRLPDAADEGTIVAHEMVGTSISSPGLGAFAGSIDPSTLGLAYANFEDHGYGRATITPQRWTTEFVIVDTIAEPTATASVDATVVIDAGTAGVRRV